MWLCRMDQGMGLFWSRLRLHTIADRQKLRDCNPGFPLDAEGNAKSAEAEPVDASDFAKGHGFAPRLEITRIGEGISSAISCGYSAALTT